MTHPKWVLSQPCFDKGSQNQIEKQILRKNNFAAPLKTATFVVLTKDSYNTVAKGAVAEIRERQSRFIAYAFAIANQHEADSIVESLRKEHHAARHHCYAWRLGIDGQQNRLNDDGEPGSTAGRPIMNRIVAADLSDVLVVVVRYFGGVLLGTSGLIAAYGDAATAVLQRVEVVQRVRSEVVVKEVDYADLDKVIRVAKRREIAIAPIEYSASRCVVRMEVRLSLLEQTIAELDKISKTV